MHTDKPLIYFYFADAFPNVHHVVSLQHGTHPSLHGREWPYCPAADGVAVHAPGLSTHRDQGHVQYIAALTSAHKNREFDPLLEVIAVAKTETMEEFVEAHAE